MRMTKFEHACVRLEDHDRTLVLDPGGFSDAAGALSGADAVLITHEHADHIDAVALRAAAAANPALAVYAPAVVAASFADLAVTVMAAGEEFDAAGFHVETFGGQHALIHPSIPVVANIGCLIDASLYHPGDSFTVPARPVGTLLVPIHAPWSKVAEVIDFVVSVRAPQAFQIHDALLNDTGLGLVEGHVSRIGAEFGTAYRHLATGETVTV
ncbi:MAG: MBL fold metallo-hydrolase [Actinomycetia bacterium]|nr:MBL fold metallo-hydrolase [Actinomycetes bacterium]